MKKKTKCYIYTRVSTAIQVDGYSLDAQKDKLFHLCHQISLPSFPNHTVSLTAFQ